MTCNKGFGVDLFLKCITSWKVTIVFIWIFIAAAKSRLTDVNLADTMIGKAVEHMFETEEGPKEEWRGMVLARAPIMTTWFYITYEKDPVLYMYQLLDDYKEGDLRIMPDSSKWSNRPLFKLVGIFKEVEILKRNLPEVPLLYVSWAFGLYLNRYYNPNSKKGGMLCKI